jgi:hypothetical protein
MTTTPVAITVTLDIRNLTAALTRAVDAATKTQILALTAQVAELERDYDALRVEWDQVTVQRDDAWRTIARLTLDFAPPASLFDDCLDWHQDADFRTGIVTTRVEHLISNAPSPPKAEPDKAPEAHMADGMSWHDASDCDPTECPTATGLTGDNGTQP